MTLLQSDLAWARRQDKRIDAVMELAVQFASLEDDRLAVSGMDNPDPPCEMEAVLARFVGQVPGAEVVWDEVLT